MKLQVIINGLVISNKDGPYDAYWNIFNELDNVLGIAGYKVSRYRGEDGLFYRIRFRRQEDLNWFKLSTKSVLRLGYFLVDELKEDVEMYQYYDRED